MNKLLSIVISWICKVILTILYVYIIIFHHFLFYHSMHNIMYCLFLLTHKSAQIFLSAINIYLSIWYKYYNLLDVTQFAHTLRCRARDLNMSFQQSIALTNEWQAAASTCVEWVIIGVRAAVNVISPRPRDTHTSHYLEFSGFVREF